MELGDDAISVIRKKIKAYESQFKTINNRKPSKNDIDADSRIRKYYKLYWKYCSDPEKSPSTSKVCQSKPAGNSAWSRSLNKQPQQTKQKGTGDRELDRFLTLSVKLQKLNEQNHLEEGKAERQLKYSLAFKRRQQLEKSKEINLELQAKKKSQSDKISVFNLQEDTSIDGDQEYFLDNVNDFIKNAILTNGPLDKSHSDMPKQTKQSIYDLDDDSIFSLPKNDKVFSIQTKKFFNLSEACINSTSADAAPAAKTSKAEKGNFRRLNMKKKSFARGHKKLNMKSYKFKSWKNNKSKRNFDNKCFKCGAPDHFAYACPSNEFLNDSKYCNLEVTSDATTDIASNLVLTVSRKNNKLTALVELLKSEPFKSLKSIIIYCTKREQTTQLETQIRTLMQFDLPKGKMNRLVRAYHAGLGTYERASIQEQFISGKLHIIVATIAFGMGINKPDISGIIHYNMPKSFENYVQEIGRAGRDGQTAYCHLFLDHEGDDLFNLQSYIYANGVDKPNLRRLVAKIYQPCKCNLLASMDDHSSSLEESSESQKRHSTCSGHPVALPIASTELEIDLKSESIYSLLKALEKSFSSAPIHVQSPSNSTATVVNFGDEADMYTLVKESAILQMGATLAKQTAKDAFTFSEFSFSFVKVAAMLSMEVSTVRSELMKLEWTTDPVTKRKKRSPLSVRFSDYAHILKAPGNLSENDIEEVVTFLSDTIEQYEAKEIFKLRFLYSKFSEFITEDISNHQTVVANSDNLKHFINEYFSSANLCPLPLDLDSSKLSLPRYFSLGNQDIDAISLVIRDFISIYYAEGVNSPRKIARILQGISSPKYPAEIWGQVRRFWRCLPMIDFKHLMELCREELVINYSLSGKTN